MKSTGWKQIQAGSCLQFYGKRLPSQTFPTRTVNWKLKFYFARLTVELLNATATKFLGPRFEEANSIVNWFGRLVDLNRIWHWAPSMQAGSGYTRHLDSFLTQDSYRAQLRSAIAEWNSRTERNSIRAMTENECPSWIQMTSALRSLSPRLENRS